MEFDELNLERIRKWVNNQTRHTDLPKSLDPCEFDNVLPSEVQKCSTCFEVPRYPLIFPCGHIECSSCYRDDFKIRAIRLGEDFITTCPICRAQVNPFNVKTLMQEINSNPESPVVKFYQKLNVRCSNKDCNLFITFSDLTDHELLKCSHRNIRCPASNCWVTARPEIMCIHACNCPLQVVWCAVCAIRISVIATGHSCEKMLQRNILLGRQRTAESIYFTNVHRFYSGDVVLPPLKPIVRFDQQTLDLIFNVIRITRGLAIMNQPQQIRATRINNQQPPLTLPPSLPPIADFLIDETTQDVDDN